MATSDPTSPPPSGLHHALGPALTAEQLHAILELRVAVFVVEQACAYQEIDGQDLASDTRHVWLEDNDGVAAYIRVLGESGDCRIGRVVTRPSRRGEQLAAQLIRWTLDRLGDIETRLEAQSHLLGYYRTFGYEPDGPEYIEDDIPHTPMVRPGGDTTRVNEATA